MAVAPWYILLHGVDPITGEPKAVALDASGNLPISGQVTSVPATLLAALPATNEPAQPVRLVPTGPVPEAQTLGVSLQNEVTATTTPTPSQKGVVTREAYSDWARYPPKGTPGVAASRHLIYPNRTRVVYAGGYNLTAARLYMWFHDVTVADDADASNAVGFGIPLGPALAGAAGFAREYLPRAERNFSSGLVVTISDSPVAWSLSASTAYVEIGYLV